MQQFRLAFLFEFGAQPFDGCFDNIGIGIKTNVPYQFGDDGFGNDLRLPLCQHFQQRKFLGDQLQPAGTACRTAGQQVNMQVTDINICLFFGAYPFGNNLQSGQQLQKENGLTR